MNFNINAHGSDNKLINSVQCEGTGAPSLIGRPEILAHVRQTGHSMRTRTCTDSTCNNGTVTTHKQLILSRLELHRHNNYNKKTYQYNPFSVCIECFYSRQVIRSAARSLTRDWYARSMSQTEKGSGTSATLVLF